MKKRNVINKPQKIKCLECGLEISAYGFTSHLKHIHNLDKNSYNSKHNIIISDKPQRQREIRKITCQICKNTYSAIGMSTHLRDSHGAMSMESYVAKYGEFRVNYLKKTDVLDKKVVKFTCLICNNSTEYHDHSFDFHLKKVHNISKLDYIKTYIFNNELPKCKCGCGKETKILTYYPYQRDYISGHNKSTLGYLYSAESKKKMSASKIKYLQYLMELYSSVDKEFVITKYYGSIEKFRKKLSIKGLIINNKSLNDNELKYTCNKCNNSWNDISLLSKCSVCNPTKYNNKAEKEISDFIKLLGFDVHKNKDILNGLEIDIYIPSLKIGFEYNSLYYHSELNVKKNKKYHLYKTELAYQKGVKLYHIFSDEWLNKSEIVKSRIKNILNLTENKIYARQCNIKEISESNKREFLMKNHLQGNDNSSIRLGAFYKDKLISVMTFGSNKRMNLSKRGNYELLRFANEINYNIIGIASKFIKYFTTNYSPESIITYADRRWTIDSNNNLYIKCGFELKNISPPNYWYVINSNYKMHRYNFRKNVLSKKLKIYDEKLTEWQNMIINGYDRIWDCGNYVFLLELTKSLYNK